MAEGRRGLGRGLSALLDEVQSASTPEGRRAAGALDLPIELIRANPDQPRRAFGQAELDELAASIRSRGVLQPILVRPLAETEGEYQIVAGERRWRAAQQAQLRSVPALVRDLNDHEVVEFALIENIQRSDLNALEEARGYAAVMKRTGYSAETVATLVGKSRGHVANTLRLMRLSQAIQEHLEAGRLTAGHARALLDLDEAEEVADRMIERGLNVRQTEALVRRLRAAAPGSQRSTRPRYGKGADTRALEGDLAEVLGLKVEIRDAGGAGELRIRYGNFEQLDDLCQRLSRRTTTN
ncbi:MAG: ParB/RepB/Spo0J family partition protein [Caulobacteraceae bacterium]|nr:ParB/RepB/Spo0J family partition protein [Caulobacteraceae bacterium]